MSLGTTPLSLEVNGRKVGPVDVPDGLTMLDFLNEYLNLTGTRLGCGIGVCHACTVIVDGVAVRSCLMLAVQANGATITTAEGLAAPDGTLHPVQQAMLEEHALQCGFCTPGVVMTLAALTQGEQKPSEQQIVAAMSGHVCRCTGYQGIRRAACKLAAAATGESA